MEASHWMFITLMMMMTKDVFTTETGQGCMREEDELRFYSRFRIRNCLDVKNRWNSSSRVYTIYPYDCCPQRPVRVFCDMETDGGGWTVIQRRDDISPRERFDRIWTEYALGFGDIEGEFWLGNDHIHALTHQAVNKIRFDMEDFKNNKRYAKYNFFYVHNSDSSYKLEVYGYSGTAGNGFSYHTTAMFSTMDKDMDCWQRNCAERMGASPFMFITLMMMMLMTRHVITTETGHGYMREEEELRFHGRFRIRNCLDAQNRWNGSSGVYNIYPYDCCPQRLVQVFCDMETDGGGWTVIQRRDDITPRERFNRIWMEYAVGFGDIEGEFWLGNDHIHALTDQTFTKIRFDMEDFENNKAYAEYKFFYVHNRDSSYKMDVDKYRGNAGNGFYYQSGTKFSTKDNDLDCWPKNCAESFGGGWWYKSCKSTNPNGYFYRQGKHEGSKDGISWSPWHGRLYSLKKMEIKIKPSYPLKLLSFPSY